nr:YhjD/YihY/BrkB family envelope integrity protein [Desulfobaculum xiamenense]
MVGHGFVADQCLLRASALAYTTVLSLVPLLAVAFSISKGFGIQNSQFIREMLMQATAGNPDVVEAIIGYINNTNVGTLGVAGVALLFMTVISLLGNIEASFNSIFGVKAQRNLWRKFSDYLAVTMVCPLLILVAISSTASLQNNEIVQRILGVSVLSALYLAALKLLPYVTTWLALLFIYVFIPNTRVRLTSALGGAILAGSLWQIVQAGYIRYQAVSTNYNAIYGSFAQVPLFLIWMFISWTIVLLGAEICFALQRSDTYYSEARMNEYSFDDRQKLGALILALLTRAFIDARPTPSNEAIASRLGAPVKLVNDVLFMLGKANIVVKVDRPGGEAYALASPPTTVHVLDVMRALARYRETTGREMFDAHAEALAPIFDGLRTAAAESPSNLTLEAFATACADLPFCAPDTGPAQHTDEK